MGDPFPSDCNSPTPHLVDLIPCSSLPSSVQGQSMEYSPSTHPILRTSKVGSWVSTEGTPSVVDYPFPFTPGLSLPHCFSPTIRYSSVDPLHKKGGEVGTRLGSFLYCRLYHPYCTLFSGVVNERYRKISASSVARSDGPSHLLLKTLNFYFSFKNVPFVV